MTFESRFRQWNQRINLASPSTIEHIWDRHILDSAQLHPLTKDHLNLVDIGTGGGFPGAVLAILRGQTSSTTLVESNRKKAGFLAAAVGSIAKIEARRIETVVAATEPPNAVTARAVASLRDLITLVEPWLLAGTRGFFMKEREYRGEIEESALRWRFEVLEHASVTDAGAAIVELCDLRPR